MAVGRKIPQKRSATIVNVADMADVSIGTVSRYLNGFQIKVGNKKRIEDAIKALSYSRNAFASAMKSEASSMVGLLVPDYDEFHAQLLGNLVTALRKEGIVTLTYCHESNDEGFRDAVNFFRTHRVSALIVSDIDERRDEIIAMMNDGVQIITYDNDPNDNSIDRVTVDNRAVSCTAVSHLLETGHSRVAIITGAMENWTAVERLAGYRDAFERNGINIPEDLIVHSNWRREGGQEAMQRLWNLPDRPTAVFGSNHQMSLGVIAYARANDIAIPEELSLISFDDIEMFQYLTPAITAISQPVDKIAGAVKQLLLRRLEGGTNDDALVEVLNCDFLKRESVAPPRQMTNQRTGSAR
ncbi:MAG: LacI family DNA-binding transcriptional regulator [Roseibium sp.]